MTKIKTILEWTRNDDVKKQQSQNPKHNPKQVSKNPHDERNRINKQRAYYKNFVFHI